ncbi:MAG: hypothetical protein A6F71_07055 [Cycloclasticus sp. symbiont of Poecilosclerida sp. M]|nr:MAG: hypothetical protein A6F71_07055 [Cycloclasticus sp. symbiont of Poecilosclerida sp. M]
MGTTVERHTHVDFEEGVECLIGEREAIANVTYAKFMGVVFILFGIVGIPYAGETLLGIGLTPAHNFLHIMTGVLWIAAVMTFDGTYARMLNQVIGLAYLTLGAFGLSESVPQIHVLFNLNEMTTVFNVVIGLVTLGVGWGVNTSHLKHWWP